MPHDDGDTEIQRVARELIACYAGEAELIAAGHADTMLDQGDLKAFEMWQKVAAAIRAIPTQKPHPL